MANISYEKEIKEISDGKYELKVIVRDNTFILSSKAWYTKEDIIEEIKDGLLLPLIEMNNSSYENI